LSASYLGYLSTGALGSRIKRILRKEEFFPEDRAHMLMRCVLIFLLAFSYCLGSARTAQSQQSTGETVRPIVRKTEPRYPEIAKRLRIEGTVKVIAVVAPDGKVKSVEPAGGHPLLIQASKDAILQWRYAPAATESRESIELHFRP